MVFRLTAKKIGMSTMDIGSEVGVQQKSAGLFKRKIQVTMKRNNKSKLKGNVEADETLTGGYTNKNKDRSLESKQAVLLALKNCRMAEQETFECSQ